MFRYDPATGSVGVLFLSDLSDTTLLRVQIELQSLVDQLAHVSISSTVQRAGQCLLFSGDGDILIERRFYFHRNPSR